MEQVRVRIAAAAATRDPVLVTGEVGVGSEQVAREVHACSSAAAEPFLVVGCAVAAPAAVEGELFGAPGQPGLLVHAREGTVFLDEVSALSPAAQDRLLLALSEGRVDHAGAEPDGVACRVIASTRHDLGRRVREDRFREDLYYRLNVLEVPVPPLRERREDLPLLLGRLLQRLGVERLELTPKAVEHLCRHGWPGNVRELANEAKRLASAVAAGQTRFTAQDLSRDVREGRGVGAFAGKTLRELEREAVLAALDETGGNKAQAARKLGVPKSTFYDLLDRHQLR